MNVFPSIIQFFLFLGKDTPPQISLQSRPKDMTRFQTPAPGEYNLDNSVKHVGRHTAPKYTFGLKKVMDQVSVAPGNLNIIMLNMQYWRGVNNPPTNNDQIKIHFYILIIQLAINQINMKMRTRL